MFVPAEYSVILSAYTNVILDIVVGFFPKKLQYRSFKLITFRVRRSRGEMCIGHGRLCVYVSVSVCLSVSLCMTVCSSPHSRSTARTRM